MGRRPFAIRGEWTSLGGWQKSGGVRRFIVQRAEKLTFLRKFLPTTLQLMWIHTFSAEWNNPDHGLRGNLTWDSYVGILRGTLTWDSYVGLLRGTLTWDSYMGLLRGNLTWYSHDVIRWIPGLLRGESGVSIPVNSAQNPHASPVVSSVVLSLPKLCFVHFDNNTRSAEWGCVG